MCLALEYRIEHNACYPELLEVLDPTVLYELKNAMRLNAIVLVRCAGKTQRIDLIHNGLVIPTHMTILLSLRQCAHITQVCR